MLIFKVFAIGEQYREIRMAYTDTRPVTSVAVWIGLADSPPVRD